MNGLHVDRDPSERTCQLLRDEENWLRAFSSQNQWSWRRRSSGCFARLVEGSLFVDETLPRLFNDSSRGYFGGVGIDVSVERKSTLVNRYNSPGGPGEPFERTRNLEWRDGQRDTMHRRERGRNKGEEKGSTWYLSFVLYYARIIVQRNGFRVESSAIAIMETAVVVS